MKFGMLITQTSIKAHLSKSSLKTVAENILPAIYNVDHTHIDVNKL